MKIILPVYIILLISFSACNKPLESNAIIRPRLLVTTDIGGDPDDQQSMVRLLSMANEFEIEGIVASASGTPGELDSAVVKPELIFDKIEAYEKVYKNLLIHSPDYPSPDFLRTRVKAGNPARGWNNIGKGHETEGSDWIEKAITKEETQPLNIVIWGGQTDVVQALFQIKSKYDDETFKQKIKNVRIYDIGDQDNIFSEIIEQFPHLFYILNKAKVGVDKREAAFRGMYLGGNMELTSKDWISNNILTNHGALGSQYPMKTWTAPNPHSCMKEGDTPSWFYFLNNGLQVHSEPTFGGWGGRFNCIKNNFFNDAADQIDSINSARATIWRWRNDFQNEFAARMDWCVLPYNEANHHPIAVLQDDKSKTILKINGKSGQNIRLSAKGSNDPDGDKLLFYWWIYPEISLNAQLVSVESDETMLKIPDSPQQGQIHVILEVKDNGTPSLKAYRRIIIEVK